MVAMTPQGFRDILPEEALLRERIAGTVRECFAAHSYLPVETPLIESMASLEQGGRVADSPFQLFDSDGGLLVLRPDLTLPIARLVSSRMSTSELPVRLRYEAPVVREEAALGGQPRQFTQLGVELMGANDPEVEVVTLLAKTLESLEVPAWRIVCASVRPLKALLESCVSSKALRKRILAYMHESDLVSLDACVDAASLPPKVAAALHDIPRLAGGVEVIDRVDRLLADAEVAACERGTVELRSLAASTPALVEDGRLTFDFTVINSFDYYTGLVFRGYSEGISAAIASGGRYDAVMTNYGLSNVTACGFMLSLERLQEVLAGTGAAGVVAAGGVAADRPLRIAVPKGSLFSDSVRMLAEAGLPTAELAHVGRRLIISAGDVEYLIVRAQDAPTFVAHGGADCGICGNDSIVEAAADVLQLVDLRFGSCRFVVAEPAEAAGAAEEAYHWRGTVRVATKYPRITRAYYDALGQQVDIVVLHGNIELGPIVGMTDRIVDITATGTTLAENNLVIVDDVMECTARFFSGTAAYRTDRRVRELASRLAAAARYSS